MEEKLRKLNYELDALTKSMADDVLFSEVVEDMRREIKKRILALNSIEGAMLEKGFDQGVLDEAKRLGGERAEIATEIEREMRERSTEIMVRRADVLHDILGQAEAERTRRERQKQEQAVSAAKVTFEEYISRRNRT